MKCFECFQDKRIDLSEHFGNIIFKKHLQRTKSPSSLNMCFRIAKVFICTSHCVPAMGFGLEAVLSKAADSRPATRAQRENDCRAQFCASITIWRMHKRGARHGPTFFKVSVKTKQLVVAWREWGPMNNFLKRLTPTHLPISVGKQDTVCRWRRCRRTSTYWLSPPLSAQLL